MSRDIMKEDKPFKQVSLPVPVMRDIDIAARQSGRSIPKEIEHAFYIAKTLAKMLPQQTMSDLKKGTAKVEELIDILSKEKVDKVLERIIEENPIRYSADPDYPGIYIRTITTNVQGIISKSVVRGIVSKDGKFQPIYGITK